MKPSELDGLLHCYQPLHHFSSDVQNQHDLQENTTSVMLLLPRLALDAGSPTVNAL